MSAFAADLLAGEVALVTGASSGLGRRFAEVLAAHGAKVVLASRRVERLEDVASTLRSGGADVATVAMDVRDPDSVESAVTRAFDAFGAVHVLVNNSGVAVSKPFLEQTEDDYQQVVDTNLGGAFRVARSVARAMIAAGTPGRIVNIASILAHRVAGQLAPYAASKAGLVRLTEAMALELARHGIRVNAIAPGYFATEMNSSFFETEPGRAMLRRVPLRRLGALSELDAPLLLLASHASSFMTGTVVTVDGGHSISSL